MATKKPAAEVQARALVDIPQARCGQAFSAPADEIAALVAAGMADDHPDAVKAARTKE